MENNNSILDQIFSLDQPTTVSQPELILTEEQKKIVLEEWNRQDGKSSIESLCEIAWPHMNLDGRTKHGKLIKLFLAQNGLKAKTKTEYEKKDVELTPEQKEYVKNNPNMKAVEIASILFGRQCTNASTETKSVYAYQTELETGTPYRREIESEEPIGKYTPPNSIDKICARINKYIDNANFDFKNLTSQQKKQCETLGSNLRSYRLVYQMNTYTSKDDRDLFESTFISYAYDKPDLTREDNDKTIILATEAVIAANKLRTIEMLQNEQERSINETQRVSMAIVDSITSATTEYNSSIKRQQSLFNDLNEKRSEKIKGKMKEAASVLNLVEIWKQEDKRIKMLKMANTRRTKLKEEVDRLESMDDLIVQISGLSEEEALN